MRRHLLFQAINIDFHTRPTPEALSEEVASNFLLALKKAVSFEAARTKERPGTVLWDLLQELK